MADFSRYSSEALRALCKPVAIRAVLVSTWQIVVALFVRFGGSSPQELQVHKPEGRGSRGCSWALLEGACLRVVGLVPAWIRAHLQAPNALILTIAVKSGARFRNGHLVIGVDAAPGEDAGKGAWCGGIQASRLGQGAANRSFVRNRP